MDASNPSRRNFLNAFAAAPLAAAAAPPPAPDSNGKRRKLGAIGNGMRGREVLRAMRAGNFPCDLVAVCDVVREHADIAIKESGSNPTYYEDYRKLLDHPGIDTVLISTPNMLHKEMVLATLARNLDLYCEKPMALNVAECDEMIKAWRSGSSVFMVGLQNRYHRLHVRIREVIAAGTIGDVRHIAATEFRGDWKKIDAGLTNASKLNWRYFDAFSGGSLLEKHCHDFDLFDLWTSSHATRVCGIGGTAFYPGRQSIDHASVALEYDNGCTISLDFNIGIRGKTFEEWIIVGTKGQLRFQRKGKRLTVTTWEPQRYEETIDIQFNPNDTRHGGSIEILADFFDCLKERKIPSANPMVGRQSVKTAQAAQLAVRNRRMVDLGEIGL